ncbi:MAG: (2Fe-2S)-binding protein [Candidatus Omnitrophica bacterium]|nr:(2Fe-2S)-binding protein [Candidatus Omnitrophota bacterium]
MANITIDGKPYTVKDGITIIEAIDQARIPLPRYCYHPGLSIAGNCRICQVEVEKMPRTVIACNTRVAEGMVIHTQSSKAKESQRVVLEFLLANHPLDCPVCDQSGECKLQDYYMEVGLYDPMFDDMKVKKTKKAFPIGPNVMLDQERCILCTRCVRYADEVTQTHEFGVFNRGDHSELDVYPGKTWEGKYAGNVVDICPVGALTDRDFRFKMRVWYLGSQSSVCPGCSRGCNIEIHYEKSRPYHLKESRVMRLKPRENQAVNQWWMCDEGRYGYKSIDENRFRPVTDWKTTFEKVVTHLSAAVPERWAVLASPQNTNEELYLVKRIFKDALKWQQIAFKAPGQEGYADNFLLKADKNPNTSGASQILGLADGGDMTAIIERAKRGGLDGLFVFSHDLAKIFGNETLEVIRKNVKTIIFEGPNQNAISAVANIGLPAASYAEKDGTFTNFEGRVQRIRKALEPMVPSKPTWEILLELAGLLGLPLSYTRPEFIFNDLAKDDEVFRGLTYKAISAQGKMWNKNTVIPSPLKGINSVEGSS